MSISSIGQAAGTGQLQQYSQASQDEIKTLEQKKQDLQKEINEINQDKNTKDEDKQKKIRLIQTQIQTIEAQLQELKQKKSDNNTSGSTEQSNTINRQDLVRKRVDIEI